VKDLFLFIVQFGHLHLFRPRRPRKRVLRILREPCALFIKLVNDLVNCLTEPYCHNYIHSLELYDYQLFFLYAHVVSLYGRLYFLNQARNQRLEVLFSSIQERYQKDEDRRRQHASASI